MNAPALITPQAGELRTLIVRAADSLASATTAAEVLDARDQAAFAYDVAKAEARLAKAKGAHDEIVAKVYHLQADALEIESMAKRRLADEYDAAQARGDVEKAGGKRGNQHVGNIPEGNNAKVADIGLTSKDVFEARQIRDAIEAQPDLLRSVLDDMLQNGEEPTKAKLRKAIAPVVTTLRADATAAKKERRKEREITLAGKIKALPDKKFGVIWADPEWKFKPFNEETGMDRAPDNHYPTSETDDICARDVPGIAANDCVLFLWATAPMLLDALRVLEAWGFEYKTHMIWAKERSGAARGPGYWFSGEHELLLIGTRGNVVAPAMGEQWRSVITARVGEHSEKPEVFLEMVEEYFPNLPKIELNRRGAPRPGWDAWGNEAEEDAVEGVADVDGTLFERVRDFMGRPVRTNINDLVKEFGLSYDGASAMFDRVIDERSTPKAVGKVVYNESKPSPPTITLNSDVNVPGLGKSNYAKFSVFLVNGSFRVGLSYWVGFTGASGPPRGEFEQFDDALRSGLMRLRETFDMIIASTSSTCAQSHKTAARKGLKWVNARLAEWQLNVASPDPATIDLEEWIKSHATSDIPAPTDDELIEYKMLGAIEAGLVVGGDMFDDFVARGLVFTAGKIELSFDGSDRLALLDRMVKAHSDGDAVECRSLEGGAA